jgi:HSP90 family molecular chaperone
MKSNKPVCYNGNFKTAIENISTDTEDTFEYYGLEHNIVFSPYREQLLSQNKFNTPTYHDKKKERYQQCMASFNECMKICVESEEDTKEFIEHMKCFHNGIIQKYALPSNGDMVTGCLPIESSKRNKRKKTLGYI